MEKRIVIENINTPQKLGVALKRLRKNKKLTQAELAKKMNMRQPTISDVENGKGTLESLFKIIQALQVNLVLGNQNKIEGGKEATKKTSMLDFL